MTSTPYVSFINNVPVGTKDDNNVALVAVGRCRINMTNTEEYKTIVNKNIEQAKALQFIEKNENNSNENKLNAKKYMKQGIAMATDFLCTTLQLDTSIIDIEFVITNYDIIQTDGCIAACFLDAGCDCIVLQSTIGENDNDNDNDDDNISVFNFARIPSNRLIANFGNFTSNTSIELIKSKIEQIQQYCSAITIVYSKQEDTNDNDLTIVTELLELGTSNLRMIVEINPNEFNNTDETQENYLPKLVGYWCTNKKECKLKHSIVLQDPSSDVLGLCYCECIKTDRIDKLYTTVVCTRTNEALGLVYSSKQSIIAALQCGRGVYYSRSRNSLWRKGDTSGNYQLLHRIDIDCDGDAVRFIVTQLGNNNNNNNDNTGSFCHLNTLTCWGQSRGINQLQSTLYERLHNAPIGSYTTRLFNDSILLQNKLLEEVQELNEATSKNDVACELADVLYFAMVKAVQSNITFDDAIIELDKRTRKVTRRQGDSKQERIDNATNILNSVQAATAASAGTSTATKEKEVEEN